MSTAGERRKGERQNSPPKSSNSRSTSRRRAWNGRNAWEETNFCEGFTGTFAASVMCMHSFGLNRSIDASLWGRDAFIQIKRARLLGRSTDLSGTSWSFSEYSSNAKQAEQKRLSKPRGHEQPTRGHPQ